MRNQIINAIKVSALAIVLSMGMSYAFAWTAPTATPPAGNVSAPINTGSASAAQTILGKLTVSATTTALDLVAQRDLFAGMVTTNQVNAATTTVTKAFVFPDGSVQTTAASGGVTSLIAGSNITLTPPSGTGSVSVKAVGSTIVYQCPVSGNIGTCNTGCYGQISVSSTCWATAYTGGICRPSVSTPCSYLGKLMP